MLVLVVGMNGCKPRRPTGRRRLREPTHQRGALLGVEFDRQGHHQLIRNASIFSRCNFLRVEPGAGGTG